MGLSFFELMHTVYVFWDLPGDVLAAPESALGLDRCNTSLSLSLSLSQVATLLYGVTLFYSILLSFHHNIRL